MPAIEFVTQSQRDSDNRAATTERLVNFYPEPLPQGARARFSLRSVLGAADWVDTGAVFIRDMEMVPDLDNSSADRLFYAAGGSLAQVDSLGAISTIGTVPDDANTTISGNSGDVTICAGGEYKLWDGSTFTSPAAGAFSSFGSVEYVGGYTLLTERNGRRIQWSALRDASSLPGLNFATAEARDDVILRGVAINGNYWVFKSTSIEIWQVTGQANENAFSAIPGLVIERGLKGFNLVTKFRGGAFFIGSDDVPYLAGGSEIRALSNLGVKTAISNGEPTHCHYHEDEGHQFLTVRFRDRPAWVFDLATGLWHERAVGEEGAWGALAAVKAFGSWRVADADGNIRTLGRTNADGGSALIRRAVSQTIYNGGERFRVPKLEIVGRVGRTRLEQSFEWITNGTFDSDLSGWSAGANWSWSGGAAALDAASFAGSTLSQDGLDRDVLKVYSFTVSVSVGSGILAVATDSLNVNSVLTLSSEAGSGTFTGQIPPGYDGISFVNFSGAQLTCTLDDVSVTSIETREPRLGLRVSRDGGNTFGALVERDMGALGEYDQRMVFHPMGRCDAFAMEVRVSDPADLNIYSSANVVLA